MSNDDGHSPETCSYNECNGPADPPCPFLKDTRFESAPPTPGCKHEWRQRFLTEDGIMIAAGYYCVFCKLVTD